MTATDAPVRVPHFAVISGAQVDEVLHGQEPTIVGVVESAYRAHAAGETVNPPSYFLRFPDRPADRIIALPASLGGERGVDGVKWISSFPGNVRSGLPRASAVLILNDPCTGYPFACLESSIISATRTAASAALAADWLTRGRGRPTRIGFVGTGLIARYVHSYLYATGWAFESVSIHDLSVEHAAGFAGYLQRTGEPGRVTVHTSSDEVIRSADLIVLATVAASPHIGDLTSLSHAPVVLHLSLRDLAPELVLGCSNVVDDAEHCLRADTSLHLAEQQVGHRDFVDGTLTDVMTGRVGLDDSRPVVFSPFGLGILDLAVGAHVHAELHRRGELQPVANFFHDLERYG